MTLQNSRHGKTSLMICIITPCAVLVLLLIAWGVSKINYSIGITLGGIAMSIGMAAPLVHLIGVIFGLLGIRSSGAGRSTSIIATAFNAILGMAIVSLWIYAILSIWRGAGH